MHLNGIVLLLSYTTIGNYYSQWANSRRKRFNCIVIYWIFGINHLIFQRFYVVLSQIFVLFGVYFCIYENLLCLLPFNWGDEDTSGLAHNETKKRCIFRGFPQ